MFSLKSAMLMTLLELVVMKVIDGVESYTEDHEVEFEALVRRVIPGEDFDALGWSVVKTLMPKVWEVARKYADLINGTTGEARLAHMFSAIREITA